MKDILILGLGILGLCFGQCAVRKEVRELSQDEMDIYINAVKKLHDTPSENGGNLSSYEWFTKVHMDHNSLVHGSPLFLPWHRQYIHLYEQELRRMDPRVVLPYWDWSLDNSEPHRSHVLDVILGGNGDSRNNYCITKGAFANWQVKYPRPHCLRRSFDWGDRVSPFASTESISLDCNEPVFSDFSLRFEIKHGNPHVNVGGQYGDLTYMYSPNDPYFFLHHTFIDLVWSEWQKRNPGVPFEGIRYGKDVSEDTPLPPFNITVKDTLNTTNYCYDYNRFPRNIQSQSTPFFLQNSVDSFSQTNPFRGRWGRQTLGSLLRTPRSQFPRTRLNLPGFRMGFKQKKRTPLPLSFVRMNNINISDVRRFEQEDDQLVDLINSVSYYPMNYVQSLIDSFLPN